MQARCIKAFDDTNQRLRKSVNLTLCVTSAILLCLIAPQVFASSDQRVSQWHSLSDVQSTAENFIKLRSSRANVQANLKATQRTIVTAGDIDDRLKLKLCATKLEAYLPAGSRIGRNTTVGVRCSGPKKWKLFVPVKVGVIADVLVATRPLPSGTVLAKSDLITQERNLANLQGGYIRSGELVTGMVLKRRLQEGEALRTDVLKAANVVQRGQSLTIESGANSGSFRIRMAGTALSDGRLGQRIRVKNRSSGQIIEGVVRSSELVETGY